MEDSDTRGLTVISEAVGHLAGPVKTSFLKALSALLGGLTAIPAAWVKRPAQAVDDVTTSRSIVSAALAKAVADDATKDPVLLRAAAEIYLPSLVRKAKNRLQVAQSAAEHIAQHENESVEASSPDDDWMNAFMRYAEDASSERLQDLFGRILAGEIIQKGSYSSATLRVVSELDQAIAQDFSEAWAESVGGAVDGSPEWHLGRKFSLWRRLSEARLLAPNDATQYLPPFSPTEHDGALWSPMSVGEMYVLVHFKRSSKSKWDHIDFTRIGREIGTLLPPPNYEANMRAAARRLPKDGLISVEFCSPGKQTELIWKSVD